MIKLFSGAKELKFETTIFPDGTSQVWKIQDDLDPDLGDEEIKILWLFENEAELFHVCQLAALIEVHFNQENHTLIVPYLPYGRQDKDVSNTTTGALNTFKDLMYASNITRIETYDAHSESDMIYSTPPTIFHSETFRHDVVCFPDKGAMTRYASSNAFAGVPTIYCEKIRNQSTGQILGLEVVNSTGIDLNGKNILIVDDICDGGMTFIKVAEELKRSGVGTIELAVSHGIFSKGLQPLLDAGIQTVYTTNSLLKNDKGTFEIW